MGHQLSYGNSGAGFEWAKYNFPDAPDNIGGFLLKSLQRSQLLVNLNEFTILIADDMSDELRSTAFKFLTCTKPGSWQTVGWTR
jgi:hypothetical protein